MGCRARESDRRYAAINSRSSARVGATGRPAHRERLRRARATRRSSSASAAGSLGVRRSFVGRAPAPATWPGDSLMKPFLVTASVVFGLIVAVHVWRVLEEGTGVLSNPWFLLSTVVSALLSGWACYLLRRLPRAS